MDDRTNVPLPVDDAGRTTRDGGWMPGMRGEDSWDPASASTPAWSPAGYRPLQLLGYGASGEVWSAQCMATGERVALKRLRGGGDAERVRLLRHEAELLAAVHHPHLVRLRELAGTAESPVLVLDLADGGTLGDLLRSRGALTPAEVVTVVVPIAEALSAAHRSGLVHGDVSPANLLFTRDGRPVLADLGVSRLSGERPLLTGGTGDYMDPAVAAGARPDAASDVFALAGLARAALLGSGPHAGEPLAALVPDLPRGWAELLDRAVALDRDERPTLDDLARGLFATCPPAPVRFGTGVSRRPRPPDDELTTLRPLADPASGEEVAPRQRWGARIGRALGRVLPTSRGHAGEPSPPARAPRFVAEPSGIAGAPGGGSPRRSGWDDGVTVGGGAAGRAGSQMRPAGSGPEGSGWDDALAGGGSRGGGSGWDDALPGGGSRGGGSGWDDALAGDGSRGGDVSWDELIPPVGNPPRRRSHRRGRGRARLAAPWVRPAAVVLLGTVAIGYAWGLVGGRLAGDKRAPAAVVLAPGEGAAASPATAGRRAAPTASSGQGGRGADWTAVLANLDSRRREAFATQDEAALSRLYAAGSPALERDLAALAQLRQGGWQAEAPAPRLVQVAVRTASQRLAEGAQVALDVVDVRAAGRMTAGSEGATRQLSARGATRWRITLRFEEGLWRYVDVVRA